MSSSGPPRSGTSPGTRRADSIPKVGGRELVYWLLRLRRRFQVSGGSMLPLLEPGDEVLIDARSKIRTGDVVVARHPHKTDVHLVKMVTGFDDSGRVRLEGLNSRESTDSRTLGHLPLDLVRGRVTSKF